VVSVGCSFYTNKLLYDFYPIVTCMTFFFTCPGCLGVIFHILLICISCMCEIWMKIAMAWFSITLTSCFLDHPKRLQCYFTFCSIGCLCCSSQLGGLVRLLLILIIDTVVLSMLVLCKCHSIPKLWKYISFISPIVNVLLFVPISDHRRSLFIKDVNATKKLTSLGFSI
jgi:hypothetical protein